MTSSQTHPRRRPASPNAQPPSLDSLAITKGATFHSPKTPSGENDPVLDIPSIPKRSLTSPEHLAAVIAASDARILDVLRRIDKNLEAINDTSIVSLNDKDACPVPRFLIAHAASTSDRMDIDEQQLVSGKDTEKRAGANPHEHASDSGLGTSVSGDSTADANPLRRCRFCDSSEPGHADLHEAQVATRRSVHTPTPSEKEARESEHFLSAYAVKKIHDHIISPILAEKRLKEYHNLIQSLPQRIGDRNITCLRDLEKTLIYLAPVSTNFALGEEPLAYAILSMKSNAKSAAAYLNFAETSIQCIHTTVEHLHERDQRRPTDRPYTNNYFLDLVQQVRQYARIMAVSKQKQREGKTMSKEDWIPLVALVSYSNIAGNVLINLSSGEKLRLQGGLSQDGEPAELIREKADGETLAIDAGKRKLSAEGFGDDAEPSMARKRKCDIGKIDWCQCKTCQHWFKRRCDLTKHEKTHTRPWKCPEVGCKYHELGWPTEKERDRHINDKHTSAPPLYYCRFEGCCYKSKRESNCKQHMEKTHGYRYVRSKARKGEHLTPVQSEQEQAAQASMPTPSSASAYQPLSTPSLTFNPSPITSSDNAFSPADGCSPAPGYDIPMSNAISPESLNSLDFNSAPGNDLFGQDVPLFGNDGHYMNNMSANNGSLFDDTPPAVQEVMDEFSGQLGSTSNPFEWALTPPASDNNSERRNSDFSALDNSISNDSWNAEFDFGHMNVGNPWPDVPDFFQQYNTNNEDPFGNFLGSQEMGESSAMAQTMFADPLIRGQGTGQQ